MSFEVLQSPAAFLSHHVGANLPDEAVLPLYERWWRDEGMAISAAVDRAGTPHLRMFDAFGNRVDEILFSPDYWRMLKLGYKTGLIWRGFVQETLTPAYVLGYVTSFFDAGLYCPYTVSLATTQIVDKYAPTEIRARYRPRLIADDDTVWQGATWMTEARGGSDLGAAVETIARREGDGWRLTGDKYFASNAGAELAVVAARPEGAVEGVRGLALFLVPRWREDGRLNYTIRRLKEKIGTRSVPTGEVELRDSEAYLMGEANQGIYLILEVLNLSRTANSMGSVALAQRALADACDFATRRMAFGKPLIEQPMMRRQFDERMAELNRTFALAWESVQLANITSRELPGFYSDTFQVFRMVTHLAKYWTASVAVDMARWAMTVYGGAGTLAENQVERWLREAMILDIWEGPPHRQILDGLEAMSRKGAHRLLFDHLRPYADAEALAEIQARVDSLLSLPADAREANAEPVFRDLAQLAGVALENKLHAVTRIANL